MYSLSVRINQITFFFFICLACLGIFNVATTIFGEYKPKIKSFNYKTNEELGKKLMIKSKKSLVIQRNN